MAGITVLQCTSVVNECGSQCVQQKQIVAVTVFLSFVIRIADVFLLIHVSKIVFDLLMKKLVK